MGLDSIFRTLEDKYSSASGPWKWGIGIVILFFALATVGYYIYRWMVMTIKADERALRMTFGLIAMDYKNPECKSIAKTYRNDIIGSDPDVIEAFGEAREYSPGPHLKLFGLHSFIVINVRPRNFHFTPYIQRGDDRYNAFTVKLTIVVKLVNILRWFIANYEPEEVVNAILEDGLRQVKAQLGSSIFEATGDTALILEKLQDCIGSKLRYVGAELGDVFMYLPEEKTETMMPEVIKHKDFFEKVLVFIRDHWGLGDETPGFAINVNLSQGPF